MASRYSVPLHERFVPVPVRARVDGWTVERQRGFILALTQGLSVPAAAERVGMSARSAYRLHDRTHAGSFRRAWAIAQSLGEPEREFPSPVRWIVVKRYQGRVVGREERWNEAAVRRVLRHRDRYSAERRRAEAEALERGLERAALAERVASRLGFARSGGREVLQARCAEFLRGRDVCDLSKRRARGPRWSLPQRHRSTASALARGPPKARAPPPNRSR